MDLRKSAEDLLALGAYKALVAAEYDRQHKALELEYAKLGLRGQDIDLPDGTRFGGISVTRPKASVSINNHTAMLEWLEAEHPTELIEKATYDIRPAYWKVLVACAEDAGVGVDPDTGEVLRWITVHVGEPSMRVTSTVAAKDMVRRLVEADNFRLELTGDSVVD